MRSSYFTKEQSQRVQLEITVERILAEREIYLRLQKTSETVAANIFL
jgi:hypothetical protein